MKKYGQPLKAQKNPNTKKYTLCKSIINVQKQEKLNGGIKVKEVEEKNR